ncbi:MAG: right-handed parallel beta-helix repeat-containing protein [Anaerolineales bacterium]|nr:right-handed parallel beta-helix repeat-containing protein [Anaerolineales bacterium]
MALHKKHASMDHRSGNWSWRLLGVRIVLVLSLLFLGLGPAGPARAASNLVSCGANALIGAVEAANATAGDDTLSLEAGCVYWLSTANNATAGGNGLPVIVDAATAGQLIIQGNGATIARVGFRVWLPSVVNGATSSLLSRAVISYGIKPASFSSLSDFRIWMVASGGRLTLDNVRVLNGSLPTQNGGGLFNAGTLTVTNSIFTSNGAQYGGGLYSTGTLVVSGSTFSGNTARLGDGILVADGAATEINNTYSGNSVFTCPVFPHPVPAGDVTRLINAIQCANSRPSDKVINLTNSTYTLTAVASSDIGPTGLPTVLDAAAAGRLTIHGNGATIERSSGSGVPDFRLFLIAAGGHLNLDGVTLKNGRLPNDEAGQGALGNYNGGAIYNAGTVWLDNSTVANNTAIFGGGIVNQSGTLTVTHSTFLNNAIPRDGAGINSFGTLAVSDSTFSGNVAQGLAGGIIIPGGTATIANTTFSGNSAYQLAGGAGLLVVNATVTITGCTFSTNFAQGAGGGLFVGGSTTIAVVDNSTFANNTAGIGGGIWSGGTLTMTHSTVSGNSADTGGGIAYTGGAINLGGTLVAGNSSPSGPDISGAVYSLGYNLIGSTASATITGITTGNLIDAAAAPLNLGSLANNGGPTLTMALGPGSVALEAGDPTFVSPPVYDQRGSGFPRVKSGRIDIGAYER